MTVNKVILIGNLGADPETRQTQSGMSVCKIRLATSERIKRQGEWQDHTEWHRVVCFGRTAENVDRYCRKGKSIYVEGRIRTEKWQDKEGRDRWTTEVIADDIRFLGGRSDGGGGGGGGSSYGGGGGSSYGGGNSGGGGNGGGNGGGGGGNEGGGNDGGGNSGGDGGGSFGGGGDDDIPF